MDVGKQGGREKRAGRSGCGVGDAPKGKGRTGKKGEQSTETVKRGLKGGGASQRFSEGG